MSEQNWDLKRKRKNIKVFDSECLKLLFTLFKEIKSKISNSQMFQHGECFGFYNALLALVLSKSVVKSWY